MGPGSGSLRRAASLAALMLAGAGFFLYVRAPTLGPAQTLAAPGPSAALGFHRPSQAPTGAEPCLRCHGGAPHRLRPRTRAFLNLHVAHMECLVCHEGGGGLTLRRPAPGARVAAGRGQGTSWAPVVWPSGLQTRGPSCSECHRRGSPILQSGLYDAYRQRILEELALLYRLQRGAL